MEHKGSSFDKGLPEDLAKIIYKYNFNIQDKMTTDDISQMLIDMDAKQMVIDVKTLENEILQIRLENYVLKDFLQKSSSKSLYRKALTLKGRYMDFNLNFQTRNELARKLAVEKGRSIDYIEKIYNEEIMQLQGNIEELKCRNKDVIELEKHFNLNFLNNAFDLNVLKTATEKYLEKKFYKFTNDWLRTSQVYILKMRFITKSLEKDCYNLHNEIQMKSSYCGVLKPIDFIQLTQNYDNLKRDFDEILVKLTGLKNAASLSHVMLNDIKKRVSKLESIIKYWTDRNEKSHRYLKQLLKEAAIVESRNFQNNSTLVVLKEKFQTYIAPSVNDYAKLKEQLVTLEKEEKILQRKIAIANIKFKNLKV